VFFKQGCPFRAFQKGLLHVDDIGEEAKPEFGRISVVVKKHMGGRLLGR